MRSVKIKVISATILVVALLASLCISSFALTSVRINVVDMTHVNGVRLNMSELSSDKKFNDVDYDPLTVAALNQTFYSSSFFPFDPGFGWEPTSNATISCSMSLPLLDSSTDTMSNFLGGSIKDVSIYCYVYVGSTDGIFKNLEYLNFYIMNGDGTYISLPFSSVGTTNFYGKAVNIYKVSIQKGDSLIYGTDTCLYCDFMIQGIPISSPVSSFECTFGMGDSSSLSIEKLPDTSLEDDKINGNKNTIDDIKGKVENMPDVPTPNDKDVDKVLSNIGGDSINDIGFNNPLGDNSIFTKFVLAVAVPSLSIAFIGYVLHGKRG